MKRSRSWGAGIRHEFLLPNHFRFFVSHPQVDIPHHYRILSAQKKEGPIIIIFSGLFRLIGGWRSQLLWRVFGFAVSIENVPGWPPRLSQLVSADFGFDATRFAVTVLGLLLLCAGPRLMTLILFSVCSVIHVTQLVSNPLSIPRVEWPVIVTLPATMAFVGLYLFIFRKPALSVDSEFEKMTVSLFRFTGVIATTFVVLHKINADFLYSQVSCGDYFVNRLQRLSVAGDWIASLSSPVIVIAMEGLIPLLLALFPVFGILFGTAFLSMFYVWSVFNINLLVIVLLVSFLRDSDKEPLKPGIKSSLTILLVSVLGIMGYSKLNVPVDSWQVAFPCIVFSVCIIVLVSKLSVGKLFRERVTSIKEFWRAFAPSLRTDYPSDPIAKITLLLLGVLMFLNSMSPYSGIKFNYSFAMFSNLRADESRWNSYLFPRWLRIFSEPDFVKIHGIQYEAEASHFLRSLSAHLEKEGIDERANLSLEIEFQGNHYKFEDAFHNQGYLSFLNDNGFMEELERINDEESERQKLFIKRVSLNGKIINPFFDGLVPSLISPSYFADSMKKYLGNKTTKRRIDLMFDYKGQKYEFVDGSGDPALWAFLAKDHGGTSLFQKVRDLYPPQRCIH